VDLTATSLLWERTWPRQLFANTWELAREIETCGEKPSRPGPLQLPYR